MFTGTVTKLHDNFGFVDEDVFFELRLGHYDCIILKKAGNYHFKMVLTKRGPRDVQKFLQKQAL